MSVRECIFVCVSYCCSYCYGVLLLLLLLQPSPWQPVGQSVSRCKPVSCSLCSHWCYCLCCLLWLVVVVAAAGAAVCYTYLCSCKLARKVFQLQNVCQSMFIFVFVLVPSCMLHVLPQALKFALSPCLSYCCSCSAWHTSAHGIHSWHWALPLELLMAVAFAMLNCWERERGRMMQRKDWHITSMIQ